MLMQKLIWPTSKSIATYFIHKQNFASVLFALSSFYSRNGQLNGSVRVALVGFSATHFPSKRFHQPDCCFSQLPTKIKFK